MNYKQYKYSGITPNQEDDIIGYALLKAGYVNEDLSEIDAENIECGLNYQPFEDVVKTKNISGEFYICAIHYSKYGNYLGEDFNYFSN